MEREQDKAVTFSLHLAAGTFANHFMNQFKTTNDIMGHSTDTCPAPAPAVEYDVLKKAFIDLLDGGAKWRNIQSFTGLDEARCYEIEKIFFKLIGASE